MVDGRRNHTATGLASLCGVTAREAVCALFPGPRWDIAAGRVLGVRPGTVRRYVSEGVLPERAWRRLAQLSHGRPNDLQQQLRHALECVRREYEARIEAVRAVERALRLWEAERGRQRRGG